MDFAFTASRLFEMLFLICFGLAWPTNIIKSARSRTARGKSLLFLIIALVGYICGITSKLVDSTLSYVLVFYLLNTCMVITDIILTLRNRRLDRQADLAAQSGA